MIIWKGLGFVVAVITFLCLLLTEMTVERVFADDAYYQAHGWPKLVGMVIAALLVWATARFLNSRELETRIDAVTGVAKAYVTRVGEGPFPTEIEGPDQERVRELGGEFGTVTGRERRCGWLDLVALRYAVRLNGITAMALTKLDVLSTFSQLPVCVRYRLQDGTETDDFPAHQSDFHHCRPIYETLPGWSEPIDTVEDFDDLPDAARAYVEFVERQLEVDVILVGTGAERERVLARAGAAAAA